MGKTFKRGFTLIELLVVISIIGILSALALTSYSGAQKQTRDTQRRSDLNQYRNGLETYAGSHNGVFPTAAAKKPTTEFCDAGGALENLLSACPADPTPDVTEGYGYYYLSSDGLSYVLYGKLETTGNYYFVCGDGKVGSQAGEPTDCSGGAVATATPTP